MNRLLTLLLLVAFANCNAQHINMDNTEQCGGYRSNNHQTKPLENVKGDITKIYCTFFNNIQTTTPWLERYEINLNDTTFNGTINRENGFDKYKFNIPNNSKIVQTLTQAIKESGLLKFNAWNVYVNGLPPITEFYISASFSTGEHLFIEFNGGHYPNGFMESVKIFNEAICKAADFSFDKCQSTKPYVNPYLGEHHFVYNKDGKEQGFKFIVENTSGKDNAEVYSTGDFGKFHARCNAFNVTGRYFFSIISYYDDSQISTPVPNSLAGILSNINGKLYLEPLQATPDLPDRSKIAEEK